MTAGTETRANQLPHHATLLSDDLPATLVAGGRQASENNLQDMPQPTASAEIKINVSELGCSERSPLVEVYELPADTGHVGALELDDVVSELYETIPFTATFRDTVKRSSFLTDFGYLKPLITSTFPVSGPVPQVEGFDNTAYLGQYILTGGSLQPVVTPRKPPPEEDFSYLGELMEVARALTSSPLPFPASPTSTPSLEPCQSDKPPISSTTSSSPATPASSSVTKVAAPLFIAPDALPPLPPKPPQYQILQHADTPAAHSYTPGASESFGTSQDLSVSTELFPPPLPPKPEQYCLRKCRSPMNYEDCVEAKYYRGISQRQQSRPERFRRYGEQGKVLHVVDRDVPGWTYSEADH